MIIAADRNIPFVTEACGHLGEVRLYDSRDEADLRACIAGAEILLCRSTVRVNRLLLADSDVRFVATSTSGTDHMDIAWLEEAGIAWAAAAGSNARSVAEWVAAVLLELHHRGRIDLVGADLGIVGVGHVGTQVADVAHALGLRTLLCDPPREERGERPLTWTDIAFSPLEELLHCRVLSLHTPLTSAGSHPTRRLVGEGQLSQLPEQAAVVNAARGEVLDVDAAATWRRWRDGALALDVFPGEPGIDPALVQVSDIATPHVAGHSLDGKLLGTQMVHDALCRFLDVPPSWRHEAALPPPPVLTLPDAAGEPLPDSPYEEVLLAVHAVVPLLRDDESLRASMQLPHEQRASAFRALRAEYGPRREFRRVLLPADRFSTEAAHMLSALGFDLR